jgi:uncharacterized protein (TIGR02646 family)
MISVKKDFDSPPIKLVESKRDELLKDAIINKNKHDFKDSIYRDKTYEDLLALYNHKCAYCETDTTAGAPLQVEHFRPKSKVTGESNHNGYYWLAYEWSNLTLGCSACNSSKGTYFPIKGTRILEPIIEIDGLPKEQLQKINCQELLSERAILLNPELDKVEDHFVFNLQGEIIGLDERGLETIKKLKLNRPRLIFWRKKILDDLVNEIRDILEDVLANKCTVEECKYAIKRIFSKITLLQNPTKPYSRFGYFVFKKFDLFITSQLEPKTAEAAKKLFEMFVRNEI